MSEDNLVPVEVEIDEDGVYVVSCSAFKACHSDGLTIGEALNKLAQVIEMCV